MEIEFRDVVKNYGGHRALDGLTLKAPPARYTDLSAPTERARPRL